MPIQFSLLPDPRARLSRESDLDRFDVNRDIAINSDQSGFDVRTRSPRCVPPFPPDETRFQSLGTTAVEDDDCLLGAATVPRVVGLSAPMERENGTRLEGTLMSCVSHPNVSPERVLLSLGFGIRVRRFD